MVIAELPAMKRYILKLHISVKYITANVVDTATGKLVASASTVEHCIKESFDCGRSSSPKAAFIVGEVLAKRLKVERLLHGGEMEARGIHADVSNEIRKEGSKNSSMIWSIVGALKTDGLKLIVDDENESGPSSIGFYHDPNVGWYYSSSDGLYYKFEDGNYVPLESIQTQDEACLCAHSNTDLDHTLVKNGNMESVNNELPENLSPPSEWLEDTLIELFLSGYSNHARDARGTTTSDEGMPEEINDVDSFKCSVGGERIDDAYTQEGGEWIPTENDFSSEDAYQDEENWRAQYGQVLESNEELVTAFPVVDLWDWTMVRGTKRNGKGEASRLVGRLVKRSLKLHPSMPSGSGLLKTAPICEVHLDLVRVTSGQVYKLRTPSAAYLSSIQIYDSSNPTKDWGFPQLSTERPLQKPCKSSGSSESIMMQGNPVYMDSLGPGQLSVCPEDTKHAYRDRAAERRTLHGGFGVGPGQKSLPFAVDMAPSSPVTDNHELAAAESLNMSFGASKYPRRILESMGWPEGEALGNSVKGLIEPLQAVGNKGNAGLGWDHSRR